MNVIAAVDENWAIGYKNRLLARIPADLRRFKTITMGHPVLLGRKTLETFPGARPLPGRENFILSSDPSYRVEGAHVLHSAAEARAVCPPDTFVIGGGTVYQAFLGDCDTAYLTHIHAAFPQADAWFPNLEQSADWIRGEEEPPLEQEGLWFQFVTYCRKK